MSNTETKLDPEAKPMSPANPPPLMDETCVVGYGYGLQEARSNLDMALKFNYGRGLVYCTHGQFRCFTDTREKHWYVAYQRGRAGLFKAYLEHCNTSASTPIEI